MLCRYRWAKEMKTRNDLLNEIAELQNELLVWKLRFSEVCDNSFDLADELELAREALRREMP